MRAATGAVAGSKARQVNFLQFKARFSRRTILMWARKQAAEAIKSIKSSN